MLEGSAGDKGPTFGVVVLRGDGDAVLTVGAFVVALVSISGFQVYD